MYEYKMQMGEIMTEYAIKQGGKWLTGNIQKGRMEYTKNREFRYTYEDVNVATKLAEQYNGIVVKEG